MQELKEFLLGACVALLCMFLFYVIGTWILVQVIISFISWL